MFLTLKSINMYRWKGFVMQALLCVLFHQAACQVTYDVTCTANEMKVTLLTKGNQSTIFVENLRGFPGCQPKFAGGKVTFKLPLDNFHKCATSRMVNKFTGHTLYYNRIIIERPKKTREELLVKCSLPGDRTLPTSWVSRPKRNVLPPGFKEAEDLNLTYIVQTAPTPYVTLAIRQNGRFLDTAYNVQPGTPLEMVMYLDPKSAKIFGILASYLKVTDGTPDHDEVIVMNGCSIDPYIFGNFETSDSGKTLYSKFKAFKFPESNYVLFVGTVNICIDKCRGVQCGADQIGYGRKKREIPAEMPFDPNKVYEVETTAVLKVEFAPDYFQPKRGSVEGTYEGIQSTGGIQSYRQRSSAAVTCHFHMVLTLSLLTLTRLVNRHH